MVIQSNNDGTAMFKCHCCAHEEHDFTDTNICILKTSFEKKDATYHTYMQEHMLSDPMLPRSNIIHCLNKSCSKDASAPSNVTYIKHDSVNMKYLYVCNHCQFRWTTKN